MKNGKVPLNIQSPSLSKSITIIGFNAKELEKQKRLTSNKLPFLAILIATLSVINFGYALEYVAPVIPQLMQPYMGNLRLDANSSAWFGSLVTIGALIGALVGGFLMDYFGRQSSIILLSLPAAAGWLFLMYAQTVAPLFIGRILTGVSVGMASVSYVVYVAETSSAETRGMFGSFFQIGITVGNTIGAAIGIAANWSYLALGGLLISVTLAFSMMFMPETPRWLLANGYPKLAVNTLRRLRGPDANVNYELEEITSPKKVESITYSELFSPGIRRPFFISMMLIACLQLTGINAVLFFCPYIFERAGFDDINVINVIASASQIPPSCLVYFLADRVGRVILLIGSSIGMAVACFTFGLYFQLMSTTEIKLDWLAMVSVFVYFAAFNLSWGALPFLVMSEILPSKARAIASGLAACVGWTVGFIVSYSFLPLSNIITVQGTFWLICGFNTASALFIYFFVPETKGKTLEEIECFFDPDKSKIKSTDGTPV